MDAAPMLKRKGPEAPEPWLDGVPVPATKIRRLLRAQPASLVFPSRPCHGLVADAFVRVGVAQDAVVPHVEPGALVVQPVEPAGAGVPPPPPQPFEVAEVPMSGEVAPAANDERAIVVYQPAEAARNLLRGPLRPEAPLRVSPDWIRGINSTVLQEASYHCAMFEELASRDENPDLAMVPWAPADANFAQATTITTSSAPATEMMDAEGASMEVEQDGAGQRAPSAGVALFPQQQQWPQQQVPAPSYHPSPVTWSW